MASKRLNERLAKYNYIYDSAGSTETETHTDSNGSSMNNENNNVIEQERVTVKKLVTEGANGLSNGDRKSTRLNSSHVRTSRMPSSA